MSKIHPHCRKLPCFFKAFAPVSVLLVLTMVLSTPCAAASAATAATESAAASTTAAAASADTSAAATAATDSAAASTAAAADSAATAAIGSTDSAAASTATTAATAAAAVAEEDGEGVIRVRLAGEPGDPVPAEVMDTDTASLLRLVSEGLVVLDQNGAPVPGCAKEWKVSDDGLKWTFYLRDDLKWADGEAMTAEDFEKMFRKIAEPSTEALYGHDLMKNIAGYEEVLNGDSDALEVSAKDDGRFVVRLSAPDPSFASLCASWALLPLREQIGDDSEKRDWKNVTGNGPYRIASIDEGQEYLLEKNPFYQNNNTPFEKVHWMVGGDINQQYSDLLNGRIDAVSAIPREEESEAEKEAEKNAEDTGEQADVSTDFLRQTTGETMGLIFNCRQEALQDPRVRKALSLAADRELIASIILDGLYVPAAELADAGPMMTAAPAENDAPQDADAQLSGDLEAAAALLEEAGHKDGKDIPALTCLVDEAGAAGKVADYLALAWKAIGVEVQIEKTEAKDLAQEKEKGMYDIVCGNLFLASDLPAAELGRFVTDTKENTTGFSSEEYDTLVKQAGETKKEDEYTDILRRAVQILDQEVPAAPLAEKSVSWIRQEEHEGIYCDASGCWQLWADHSADEDDSQPAGQTNEQTDEQADENDSQPAGQTNGQLDAYFNNVLKNARETESAGAATTVSTAAAASSGTAVSTAAEASTAMALMDNPVLNVSGLTSMNSPVPVASSYVFANANTVSAGAKPEASGYVFANANTVSAGAKTQAFAGIAGRKDPNQDQALKARAFDGSIADPQTSWLKTDQAAYLTRQAYVLEEAGEDADRLVSLPKYTQVHLTGTGSPDYVRISMDGRFRYLEAGKVTTDVVVLEKTKKEEKKQKEERDLLAQPAHLVKEHELGRRAGDILKDRDQILAEIAFMEKLRNQTSNPNWGGPVLSRSNGSIHGPSGKETYYNLNMNGVVNIMRRMGNMDEYWVRNDGCKMLGNYIMCAANLHVHPRGSLVESSLGTCIVCDTGGFAHGNSNQLDIAVTW